jgi:hypothetical protein
MLKAEVTDVPVQHVEHDVPVRIGHRCYRNKSKYVCNIVSTETGVISMPFNNLYDFK